MITSAPRLSLLAAPLLAALATAQSPEPTTSGVRVAGDDRTRVELTIRWPNAWRNARNHDAAWLVLRGPAPTAGTLRLAAEGHQRLDRRAPATAFAVPADR
ncbi:MAG: hypothetical protein KAI24_10625, partial [Planctomycetes bacterium]|nr:hypothetical protein [Planctomycetota bacterium]